MLNQSTVTLQILSGCFGVRVVVLVKCVEVIALSISMWAHSAHLFISTAANCASTRLQSKQLALPPANFCHTSELWSVWPFRYLVRSPVLWTVDLMFCACFFLLFFQTPFPDVCKPIFSKLFHMTWLYSKKKRCYADFPKVPPNKNEGRKPPNFAQSRV